MENNIETTHEHDNRNHPQTAHAPPAHTAHEAPCVAQRMRLEHPRGAAQNPDTASDLIGALI